jgi:nucleotide-binding universal stress UspA family protein
MGTFVSKDMLQKYYDEECQAMLAPSRGVLDAAGVAYTTHQMVGPIAESIVEQATKLGSSMIFMGTRGMSALAQHGARVGDHARAAPRAAARRADPLTAS